MSIVFPQSVSGFCVDAITWDWEPGTRDLGPGNLPGTRDLELGTWDLGPGTWDLALGTGSGSKRGRQQAQHVQHAAAGAACGSRRGRQQAQHAAGAACGRRSRQQAQQAAYDSNSIGFDSRGGALRNSQYFKGCLGRYILWLPYGR